MKIKYNNVLIKIQVKGTINISTFLSFDTAIKYAPALMQQTTAGIEHPDMILQIKYFHRERTDYDIYTAGETFRETHIEHLYQIAKNEVMEMIVKEHRNSVEVEREEEDNEEE